MRWPWNHPRPTAAERQAAEARARETHEEVVVPLRQLREEVKGMRARDYLTEAIVADIRRRLKESS